ncbi:MAG: rod shape-determining protein [Acidimicrobiia bacterium]|nr:rod shape-determining protein [Acidimicrobiia bacterium]
MPRVRNNISSAVGRGIAVDLGTATTIVYVRGEGVVLEEPSVAALDARTDRLLAVGRNAKEMIGRTPANIRTVRPLKEGVIADFGVCEKMLRYFIQQVHSNRFAKPRMVICVPSGITPVEQRAVQEVAEFAGARRPVFIIEEPMAAAIGAGVAVQEPSGSMIVDVGGGTTEVAVISLGGIVVSRSVRVAGDDFDQTISDYIRKEYSLGVGEQTTEQIKVKYTSAWPLAEEMLIQIPGRDLVTGLPKSVSINTIELREAVDEPLNEVIAGVQATLDAAPPELTADIMESGIHLAGGGSRLLGLAERLAAETAIKVNRVKNPQYVVAYGSGYSTERRAAFAGR